MYRVRNDKVNIITSVNVGIENSEVSQQLLGLQSLLFMCIYGSKSLPHTDHMSADFPKPPFNILELLCIRF